MEDRRNADSSGLTSLVEVPGAGTVMVEDAAARCTTCTRDCEIKAVPDGILFDGTIRQQSETDVALSVPQTDFMLVQHPRSDADTRALVLAHAPPKDI